MLNKLKSSNPFAYLPTDFGNFRIQTFDSDIIEMPHVILIPELGIGTKPVLLRIHSECLTGDVFGSRRCDCGYQLHKSLQLISQEGGILIYLRQEGRGIGLTNKIHAYALQDEGADTIEANQILGFESDERDYSIAVQILELMKIDKVKLLTNNPLKIEYLKKHNIQVLESISILKPSDEFNSTYLLTKKTKMGHFIP